MTIGCAWAIGSHAHVPSARCNVEVCNALLEAGEKKTRQSMYMCI